MIEVNMRYKRLIIILLITILGGNAIIQFHDCDDSFESRLKSKGGTKTLLVGGFDSERGNIFNKDEGSDTIIDGIPNKILILISLGLSIIALVFSIYSLMRIHRKRGPYSGPNDGNSFNAADLLRDYNPDKKKNQLDNLNNNSTDFIGDQISEPGNDLSQTLRVVSNGFEVVQQIGENKKSHNAAIRYVPDYSNDSKLLPGAFRKEDFTDFPTSESYFKLIFNEAERRATLHVNNNPTTNFTPILNNINRLLDLCEFTYFPSKHYSSIQEVFPGEIVEVSGIFKVTKKIKIELIEGN